MSTDTKHFMRYWLPVILYAGLIFVVSSFPLPEAKVEIPFADKFLHLVEYGMLSFLLYRAVRVSSLAKQTFILSIILSVLYALSDEVHQFFVPGRRFDLGDLVADSLGIVLVACYLKHKAALAKRIDK